MGNKNRNQILRPATIGCVVAALTAVVLPIHAQDANTNTDKLEKENQELKQRLDKLEDLLKKEGITPNKNEDLRAN
jgi:hypothetical protein